MGLLEPLFSALNRSQVRYVVVGGVATVLHGFARLTADVDLVVDLEPAAARATIATLLAEGFQPRSPVNPYDFADPSIRARWASEKGMRVFSLRDPANPLREVDLFVESPIAFEALWGRSEAMDLGTVTVRVASIPDLITLKKMAGRPQDLVDVEALEEILGRRGG
ncbi:MAG TPA: nucleotidyl transferase AbiEii/AbiGii toxin family protein [Candidatus Binatia bacterium]|jgi:hypothetical protein|nr:nucleotidyl transferase AbiEii/AbiGii toxin family protein [Candidatus Binatia bacterium]